MRRLTHLFQWTIIELVTALNTLVPIMDLKQLLSDKTIYLVNMRKTLYISPFSKSNIATVPVHHYSLPQMPIFLP